MKDSQTAYDNLRSNLMKSTAAVPLHLQGVAATNWWEDPNSLLAKSSISGEAAPDRLEKSFPAGAYITTKMTPQADDPATAPVEGDAPVRATEALAKALTGVAAMAAETSVEDELAKSFADLDAFADSILGGK